MRMRPYGYDISIENFENFTIHISNNFSKDFLKIVEIQNDF